MLEKFADEFGQVWVTGVVGNHGRHDKKPLAKMRAKENFDWLFMHMIRTVLEQKGEKRIQWFIANGQKQRFNIFDQRIITSHGDECKGGSGIAGMLSPQLIAYSRMKKTYDFDQWWIGHWHHLSAYRGIRVNGCFTADTLVQTDLGVKPIADVQVGDCVLTHNGNVQTVTDTMAKQSCEGLVKLKVRGLPEPLQCTPNHEIWAIKGETGSNVEPKWRGLAGGADKPQWIPADFISPGDWVSVPSYPDGGYNIDTELAWVYGLYLAEGCAIHGGGKNRRQHRIDMIMHISERAVLERAKRRLDNVFKNPGRLCERPEKNTCALLYSVSPAEALDWQTRFGHYSHGKKLPAEFLRCTPKTARALIQGWLDGDGHTATADYETTYGKTVSRDLAYAMFAMALKAGQRPSLSSMAPGGPRLRRSYSVHFNAGQESREVNGQVFYRVAYRWRTDEVVPVYDLTVDVDHTYNAGLVGCHNSGKGYDEYAAIMNFDYQVPLQDFFLVAPGHKDVIASWPVHCMCPDELWAKQVTKHPAFSA
jgi:hypothetical protein